jgi:hypothetical protein
MSKILEHNTISDLPVIALIIFMTVFVIVTIRVLLMRNDDPDLAYVARLPLGDDEMPQTQTAAPTPTRDTEADRD